MSTNVIDFSDMFRKNKYSDVTILSDDKENRHINTLKSSVLDQNDDDLIKKATTAKQIDQAHKIIESSNEALRWQEKALEISNEMETVRSRLHHVEKEKEKSQIKIDSLLQEVTFVNSKLAANANEFKAQKSKWLAEKTELESKVFQLIAAQTQYQGTLVKKEKEFEKLQNYLQKQITSNNKTKQTPTSISSKSTSKITSSTPANNVASNNNVLSSIVISKPLPTNTSQNQNISTNAAGLAKDLEVVSLKQVIADLQTQNNDIKDQLQQFSNGRFDSCDSATSNGNVSIRDILILQTKLSDLEQLYHKTKAEKESLEALSRKRDREYASSEIDKAKSSSSAINSSGADHVINNAITDTNNSTLLTEKEKEIDSLKQQLKKAWETINQQDALVHQALLGRLNGVMDIITDVAVGDNSCSNPQETDADISQCWDSPQMKKSKTSDIDYDALFELPPASPATVALLKSCGWTDLPKIESTDCSNE